MKGSRPFAAVVAALLLPSLGFAQDEPATAPAAAPAPVAAPAAPAAPAAAPAPVRAPAAPEADADAVKQVDEPLAVLARAFYATLLRRDAEALVLLCRPPFYFEAQPALTQEQIKERWSAALQSRSFDAAHLYGVELFTPEALAEKYGKPPERLAAWPLKGAMISVGNVDGRPLLVLWRRVGAAWAATAFHD